MKISLRRRGGFSLPELLVSVAILGVITMYLARMLTTQSRAYDVVDQVTEVQQNLRAIAGLLDREVRMTGFLVPEGGGFCGFDFDDEPDALFLTDSRALSIVDDDVATIEFAGNIVGGYTPTSGGVQDITVAGLILDETAAYDLDTPPDGTNDSDYQPNGGVIVFDRNNLGRGTACGIVESIVGNTLRVDFTNFGTPAVVSQLGPNPPDAWLVAVPANVYEIDTVTDTSPRLLRNRQLLAEDVEDLQFAAFLDADGDGLEDLGEYAGSGLAGEPDYLAQGTNHSTLVELRVNLVVRSRLQDREFGDAARPAGRFQTTENRTFLGNNDQFRRRVYSARIRPRNL